MNDEYYVKTEEKEHTVKIQNEEETFHSYDAELIEDPTKTLVEKTITENGEYLPASDNADGYSKVTVNVPSSELPILFAPVITQGTNTVSWENDTRNGSFAVTLSATIDGLAATSPLTITEEMDGKTLIVVASSTNFHDASTSIELVYVNTSVYSVVSMSGYSGSEPKCGFAILKEGTNSIASEAFLNGVSYPDDGNTRYFMIPTDIGNSTINFSIVFNESGTLDNLSVSIYAVKNAGWYYFSDINDKTKDYSANIKTMSCSWFINGEEIDSAQSTNSWYARKSGSWDVAQGDVLTVSLSVTY